MGAKKFIVIVFSFLIFIVSCIGIVNYVVNPYGIYNHAFISLPKNRQSNMMKLVKALKIEFVKPSSIILGTSRAEYGYDPSHNYFVQPAYNLATSGASMYENLLYFEKALKEGNLEKVLIVADWIMFNTKEMTKTNDFEEYFTKSNRSYIFTIDMFIDSFYTIFGKEEAQYLDNGQRGHTYNWERVKQKGGHLQVMNYDEKRYYNRKDYPHNENIYQDTKMRAFNDFEKILHLAYENDVTVDVVFGPSHIRQWEAFAYYHDYNIWLQWKKDVVLAVERIATMHIKKPFRVMDFSVYHELTAEAVPTDKNQQMKYHWEGSHYKHELGLIVLDRLIGNSEYNNFGVELSIKNINNHLENIISDRKKFINTKQYRKDVFEEY